MSSITRTRSKFWTSALRYVAGRYYPAKLASYWWNDFANMWMAVANTALAPGHDPGDEDRW